MGNKRKRRKRTNAWVDLREIQAMRAETLALLRREGLLPGSEEYSLYCALSALNGNYPRIKKSTWERVSAQFRDIVALRAGLERNLERQVVEETP